MANTQAFECDECGNGVILWKGYQEEIFDDLFDFVNVTQMHEMAISPGGFCYSCHLRVN